jgi:hypothetical protein
MLDDFCDRDSLAGGDIINIAGCALQHEQFVRTYHISNVAEVALDAHITNPKYLWAES